MSGGFVPYLLNIHGTATTFKPLTWPPNFPDPNLTEHQSDMLNHLRNINGSDSLRHVQQMLDWTGCWENWRPG